MCRPPTFFRLKIKKPNIFFSTILNFPIFRQIVSIVIRNRFPVYLNHNLYRSKSDTENEKWEGEQNGGKS